MSSHFINYLTLLDIHRIENPTYDFLKKIHRTHIETIAYSNLDFLFQIGVTFDIENIISKFMSMHPSGICYELNYALAELLTYLGFDVQLVYANLPKAGNIIFRHSEIAHVVGLVHLDNTIYLMDVGFSHWFRYPIDLYHSAYQDVSGDYRITTQDNMEFFLETKVKNKYGPTYSFRLNNPFNTPPRLNYSLAEQELYPNLYGDFRYSLPTATGCKTILKKDYIETTPNGVKITPIHDAKKLQQILINEMRANEYFILNLPQVGFDQLFYSK